MIQHIEQILNGIDGVQRYADNIQHPGDRETLNEIIAMLDVAVEPLRVLADHAKRTAVSEVRALSARRNATVKETENDGATDSRDHSSSRDHSGKRGGRR